MSRARPIPVVLLLPALLLTGCAGAADDPGASGAIPDAGVAVRDLVFEVDESESGARLVVKARRARFTDLPGRGRGELAGVVVQASAAEGRQVAGEAERATLDGAGAVTLHKARVTAGDGEGFALTADSARLGLDGRLEGRGVKARLREPRQGDVE